MYIRATYRVGPLGVSNKMIALAFSYPHRINMQIESSPHDDGRCTSICEVDPSASVAAAFSSLADDRLPRGSRCRGEWSSWCPPDMGNIDANGFLSGSVLIPLRFMPEEVEKFVLDMSMTMQDTTERSIRAMRWRFGLNGNHGAIEFNGYDYSFDGSLWHAMPHFGDYTRAITTMVIELDNEDLRVVESLVTHGGDEPLGHTLLREAWHERFDNPRSALVLGMTAAEVGMKGCIGTLVPQAEWLSIHMPTPPLVKMVSEYLPQLMSVKWSNGDVPTVPKNIRKALADGAEMRNRTAHAGAKPPGWRVLERILVSVHDFLCLLDYYCGHEWTLDYLSSETRAALQLTTLERDLSAPFPPLFGHR